VVDVPINPTKPNRYSRPL